VKEYSTVEVVMKQQEPELQTDTAAFCNEYSHLNTFLGKLGTAFSFVQTDITSKLQNIREHNEMRGGQTTLEGMMLTEMNENTIRTPTSAGRNLLRLVRALDFIVLLFEGLDKKQELVACANEAYSHSLKPHHPWVIRTMVAVALKTLPYRADFMRSIGLDPDKEHFGQVISLVRPLSQRLTMFYETHKISDLG